MSKHNKRKSPKCTPKFVSAWDKREKALELVEDDSFDLYLANDEFGVIQTSSSDVRFVKEQAALLFGTSSEELIFRASFDCFVKIQTNEHKKEILERLYKSRFASFYNISDPLCANTVHGIPVCLNALSMIPQANTEKDEPKSDDAPEEIFDLQLDDCNEMKETIEQIETLTDIERSIPHAEEIQNVIDKAISQYGGYVYVRFRPRGKNNRLYPDDFVMIGNRFFEIVFANLSGDWLADEESFDGEHPYWYSETSRSGSPVFQAMKFRDLYGRELPNITIESIVVVPSSCTIINDEDMLECWEKECHTMVLRSRENDESSLQTLLAYLESLPKVAAKAPQLSPVEVNQMSIRFTDNPDNWVN